MLARSSRKEKEAYFATLTGAERAAAEGEMLSLMEPTKRSMYLTTLEVPRRLQSQSVLISLLADVPGNPKRSRYMALIARTTPDDAELYISSLHHVQRAEEEGGMLTLMTPGEREQYLKELPKEFRVRAEEIMLIRLPPPQRDRYMAAMEQGKKIETQASALLCHNDAPGIYIATCKQ